MENQSINSQVAEGDAALFMTAFRGSFVSALRWHQLDALWARTKKQDNWYIYAIGEEPPVTTSSQEQLDHFIDQVDALLRADHEEDYCGIVYADDHENPSMIKIYDPHNLGVTCGYSDNPPLPGWVLSRIRPVNLVDANHLVAKNRKRWWQRIFS